MIYLKTYIKGKDIYKRIANKVLTGFQENIKFVSKVSDYHKKISDNKNLQYPLTLSSWKSKIYQMN
jgi:hypothetical protein